MHAWPNHACIYMFGDFNRSLALSLSLVGGQQHTCTLCAKACASNNVCALDRSSFD